MKLDEYTVRKKQILNSLEQYLLDKKKNKKWSEGNDWVSYSGPHINEKEILSVIGTILEDFEKGWVIFGENNRNFEKKFPSLMGKKFGVF